MSLDVSIAVKPYRVHDDAHIVSLLRSKVPREYGEFEKVLLKKSLDARKRPIFRLRYRIYAQGESPASRGSHIEQYQNVAAAREVHIIGAGPAGYFAGLELLKLGLKPVIFDRGKDVRQRRRDLRAIQQFGEVNPHSNYCFGEGGAGTYSDGKLYTRSHKRGPVRDVLETLVDHGAKLDILTDAHPHIGSNKLPQIIQRIRESIISHGGEVHFEHFLEDIDCESGELSSLVFSNGKVVKSQHCLLATGHSAKDIYHLLHRKYIVLEAKEFAVGFRLEHPQSLIDSIQYGRPRGEDLPAARYALNCKIEQGSVYSFCMCPGGLIVPTATSPGELVINGMSLSRRDSPFANSGIVTPLSQENLESIHGQDALGLLRYQTELEKQIFSHGDGGQKAPAQRMTDFVDGRQSADLDATSYIPGLYSAPLHELMPAFVVARVREALRFFGKRLPGFLTREAQLLALESRTSSPVRIPRKADDHQHPQIRGLYPVGEGAGYAGGIMSAALDGMRTAHKVAVCVAEG